MKRLALSFILVLIASVISAGALAVSADDAVPQKIEISARVQVSLVGENALYTFRPEVNSVYGVYLFAPADSAAWLSARLYRANGRLVAVGDASAGAPCAITARLTAGESYRLEITGAGQATMEIARKTLGRCFDDPIRLDESGSYAKLIAREGDSHWYAFRATANAPTTIAILPDENSALELSAVLLSASGKTIAGSSPLYEGGCAVYAPLENGKIHYLRVAAGEQQTGAYHLQVMYSASETKSPESIALDRDALSFNPGGRQKLTPTIKPAGAHSALIWRSSDSAVATVTDTGEVIAIGPGEAIITAYGYGEQSASCTVTVQGVPLTGVRFTQQSLRVRTGQSTRLTVGFEPAGAYTRHIQFSVEDESVVRVAENGQLTALAEGVSHVLVSAEDGRFTDSIEVVVEPAAPRYRALLVGEQLYLPEVNKVRTGAINTVQSLSEMLAELDFGGQTYETALLLDTTRPEAVSTIRETFASAAPQDVSLFYITCHGYYLGGMSYLQFHDGSLLSAVDLERELRKIPGTVVVLIDCCGSGGFLGKATALEDFNRGIISVFSGYKGSAVLASTKYKVLTSAFLDEDSYRISFDENLTEGAMATVFARALSDAAGWDIRRSRRSALRADADMDRIITLQEAYQYASRRVTWYLRLAGGLLGGRSGYTQNVQVFPEGDPFILFKRAAQ